MSFGKNLQYFRKLSGNMTQEALAEKLNVSRQTISKWEIDAANPEMEKALKDSLTGVTTLEMDFSKLDYISSAGLRVLLSTQKIMHKQGEMKVLHVNEMVMEVFEVTGFVDILNIE